jgi:UPF0716 protein FxsA
MPVFVILLLLFIGLPTVEIYVLIKVGHEIGALWTIVLLFAIAALGSALLRLEGLATLRKVQAAMARGEVPTAAILDGLVLVVAGVLMVTPGFVTDLFAFLLLLPPLRRVVGNVLAGRLMMRVQGRAAGGPRASGPQVLEGDYRVERDPRDSQ